METSILLRLFLFSGLVLHKLVWEVMKRQDGQKQPPRRPQKFGLKSVVKLGKMGVLLFLVIQTLFLDLFPILENSTGLRWAGILIYVLGLAMAILGRLQLGNNWANLEDYQVLPEQALVRSGIYRYIRHPIYSGDILLLLGLELALNSWLVILVLGLVLFVVRQTILEEGVLSKTFPDYERYRQQTKMFIPFVV